MNCIFCHNPTTRHHAYLRRCPSCDVGFGLNYRLMPDSVDLYTGKFLIIIYFNESRMTIYNNGNKLISLPYLLWMFPNNLSNICNKLTKLLPFL